MKRNYGIDLLRMVLMYMVVVLHVLGHGGVLDALEPLSVKYSLAWLLECLALCAVNGYALVTGYLYFRSKWRLSSLVQLWIQVWIYSVGIAGAMWLLKPEYFSAASLIQVCFPLVSKVYWYFSAYAGLFVLIPVLNAAVEHLDEKGSRMALALAFLMFSVLPVFSESDPFGLKSGYSTFWLAFLYLIGASIRKYGWGKALPVKKAALLYVCCVGIGWLCKLGIDQLNALEVPVRVELVSYTAPTTVLAAVGLFLAFEKMKLGTAASKAVSTLSPGAFGVYLIHEHPNFRAFFMSESFRFLTRGHPIVMAVGVLGCAAVVFGACLSVDCIRAAIFRRLNIRAKAAAVDSMLGRALDTKERQR